MNTTDTLEPTDIAGQTLEGLAPKTCSALSVKLHELQTLLGKIIDTPEDWDWDWRTDARELHEELEDLLKRQPERHESTQAFVDWCPDKSAGIRQAYYHGYMDGSASWPNASDQIPRTQDVANTTDSPERLSASVLFVFGGLFRMFVMADVTWLRREPWLGDGLLNEAILLLCCESGKAKR